MIVVVIVFAAVVRPLVLSLEDFWRCEFVRGTSCLGRRVLQARDRRTWERVVTRGLGSKEQS